MATTYEYRIQYYHTMYMLLEGSNNLGKQRWRLLMIKGKELDFVPKDPALSALYERESKTKPAKQRER